MSGHYWKSVSYAACIGVGLFAAYLDGVNNYGLLMGAIVGVGLVILLFSAQIIWSHIMTRDKKD